MLRVIAILLLVLTTPLGIASQPTQEGKKLRWKFAVGQKLRVETQSDMTRTTKIKANVDETKIKTTIELIWEVKAVDAAGVATIEQRPERLAITLEHRLDPKYVLDSAILKKNPNLKGADRDAMKLLMEGHATIKIDSRGVVLEASLPPDWLEKVKQSPIADLHDQLLLAATPQLFPGVQLSLPEREVNEGYEWRVEAPKAEGKPTSPAGEAKFVFRGEKALEGQPRDQIDVDFKINGLPEGVTVTSQSNQGQFWFDSTEGRPAMLQVKQDWKAEKHYRDVVILLTTTGSSITTWQQAK